MLGYQSRDGQSDVNEKNSYPFYETESFLYSTLPTELHRAV